MEFKTKISVGLVFFLLLSMFGTGWVSANSLEPRFESVHYLIGSDGRESNGGPIKNLQIKTTYQLDYINSLGVGGVYNSDDNRINLHGKWAVDFLQLEDYDFNLNLNLVTNFESSGNTLVPGFGMGIKQDVKSGINLFARADYYITERNNWVYEGGISLPLISKSKLTISLGNNYWQRSGRPMLTLGLLMIN
ncbi:MAG: hypothetical protein ACOCQ1_00365 [Halanaerobiaceae bacterium]